MNYDYTVATTRGCNLETLDQMVLNSSQSFGHLAKVTVIKGTAKHPRMVFGACQRNYTE